MKIFSPFRLVIFFVSTSICSLFFLRNFNVDLMPQNNGTVISVRVGLPNSSPNVVEQQITSVLENVLSQVSGIKKILSSSYYNYGVVWLYFDASADFTIKQFEITSLIRQLYPHLPANASYPLVTPAIQNHNATSGPILTYTIHATQQPFRIKQISEELILKKISGTPGLKNAQLSGVEQLQLVILFDLDKCNALKVDPYRILTSLRSSYAMTYHGSFYNNSGEQYFLKINGPNATLTDIENTIITTPSGILKIKDIARLTIEEEEPKSCFRINGQNAISLRLFANAGENVIMLGNLLKQQLKHIAQEFPDGYHIQLQYDDTAFLQKELNKNYKRALLSMSILLIFILLSYRNWRYVLVILVGLVVSICFAIMYANIFRVPVHLYTIAGIAIAFGLMIDNTIVMLDYCHQFQQRKAPLSLLAATLTTMAALGMVFFLPDEQKNNLRDFAIIIVLALSSSVIVALWFIPAMCKLLLSDTNTAISCSFSRLKKHYYTINKYFACIRFIARHRIICVSIIIFLFGVPFFLLPPKWKGDKWFNKAYNATIGSEMYQLKIRPVTDKWFGGSLQLFANNVREKAVFRASAKTKLYMVGELPVGNTVTQMNVILSGIETFLSSVACVDKYVTNINSGEGGSIEITFKEEYENTSLPHILKSELIRQSINWGGVTWNIFGVGEGFSNKTAQEMPQFRIKMKGYNYEELERQASVLEGKLARHPRVQKIDTNERLDYSEKENTEYSLKLNKAQMAMVNTNQSQVLAALKLRSLPSCPSSQMVIEDLYYPVLLREINADKYSSYDILNTPLALNDSKAISISQIGAFEISKTASSIKKEDRQYLRVVSFEYIGSFVVANELLKQTLEEMRKEMPVGYSVENEQIFWNWAGAKKQYQLIFILLFAVFFICSIVFENLKQPFFIVTLIPLSFIGLFLTFVIGGFRCDQGGYAAMIMLCGIVVNESIYIINDLNYIQKKTKRNFNKQLIRAAYNRSKTVLLTTMSTICGLIPFLLDGENEVFWYSFAIGVIGGLSFSIVCIFFFLPAFLCKKNTRGTVVGETIEYMS